MKLAAQVFVARATAAANDFHAAMGTSVVERLDATVLLTHHGDGLPADRALVKAARVGDFLFSTRGLPYLGKQSLELEVQEFRVDVPALGHESLTAG